MVGETRFQSDESLGIGYLIPKNSDPIEVPITIFNEDFFIEKNDQPEVVRQGSHLIVSLLQNSQETMELAPPERGIRLFDNYGVYYPWVKLVGLEARNHSNGHERLKHTATFEFVTGKQMEIPIDDIRAIGGSTLSAVQNPGAQQPTSSHQI